MGSTNFDNRSFRLNDEANLTVYHARFARLLLADVFADRQRSRTISLHEWRQRPWREKLIEHAAALLRSPR